MPGAETADEPLRDLEFAPTDRLLRSTMPVDHGKPISRWAAADKLPWVMAAM